MNRFKKLAINVGLAFVAAFATTFATLLNSTPKAPDKAALLAVVGAAIFAGIRAVVGFVALQASGVPAIPTDK
jgi:predicted RND superfamily exporter protein